MVASKTSKYGKINPNQNNIRIKPNDIKPVFPYLLSTHCAVLVGKIFNSIHINRALGATEIEINGADVPLGS